jgi:crotonobetainyl-CoA:carnitine CoA-transferase CaiB-like acyl-CoA transferase
MERAMAAEAWRTLESLWAMAKCDRSALERAHLTGADPVLPSTFKVGTAAAATVAATGLAAAEIWRSRTGRGQTVSVDARSAAIAFRSERYLRIDGEPPPDLWDPIAGYYPTGDEGWIQLHTNFPHHRDGVLAVLGCENQREAVAGAVSEWEGQALEDALAERGMCATMMRSREQWRVHPQAQAIDTLPLFEIIKLGDSPRVPAGQGERPLAGVRALDLTRIIAGPVCGRTLAEHGADVMRIGAEHLPSVPPLVIDTGRGRV